MMESITVYTAISGDFEPARKDGIPVYSGYTEFKSNRRNAKIYKILSHLFIPSDISIWLDGNIQFREDIDIEAFTEEFLGNNDIAVFKHPWRSCAYDEAVACIANNLDEPDIILQQINRYRSDDFPTNYGLAECGVIIRRNNWRVNRLNEAWWAQVCRYSSRDQISFPYVQWRMGGVRLKLNEGNVRDDSRFIYRTRQSSYR